MITEEQRKARKEWIGSSDVAAVVGVSPFASAYDVWLEKTGKLAEEPPSNDAMDAGNWMEPAILNFAESELGELQRDPDTIRHASIPMASHVDAIALKTNEPVEAKNVDLMSPLFKSFGEPGTDQVAEYVITQATAHMMCMQVTTQCHVPVCLGGRFAMFYVPWNPELGDFIGAAVVTFWDKHVKADIPPENATPCLDLIKRVRRTTDIVAHVDPMLFERWSKARELRLAYEKAESAHQAELLAAMRVGSEYAECADFGDDGLVLTYLSQKSAPSIDQAAMKRDGIFDKYATQGTHRVLRASKRKD